MNHHDIKRLPIANQGLAMVIPHLQPAFAAIAASGMKFAQTSHLELRQDIDLSAAKEFLTDAKRSVQSTLDELRKTDTAVSTVDFADVMNELIDAGLLTGSVGELFDTYDKQGAVLLFGSIDTMIDRALKDAHEIENLTTMVSVDVEHAVALAVTYHTYASQLWNVNMMIADAARRIEELSPMPALVGFSQQSLKIAG